MASSVRGGAGGGMRFGASIFLGGCLVACASTPGVGEGPELLRKVVRIGVVPFERVLVARDRPEASRRETVLRELFRESGCQPFDPIRSEALRTPAVVCRIEGAGPGTILVTSEFGRSRGGRDGWEAASLLPLIAQSVSAVPRANTVLFAAFGDDPYGYRTQGAVPRTLAMFPPGERPPLKAWISLTASSRAVRAAWKPGSSGSLLSNFLAVARHTGTPVALLGGGEVEEPVGRAPSLAAVLGHGVDDDYLASYRTFAAFIAFADYAIDARANDELADARPTPL